MSYCQQIEGVQLDMAVVDACAAAVQGKGNGRVSSEDAHQVFKYIKDDNKVTSNDELWALRYCLTEFNFTEAAGDWITSAVGAISKRDQVKAPQGGSSKSCYEQVDGVECDRELLEVCKAVAGTGDGRLSKDDAEKLPKDVGPKVMDTQKWSVRLCLSDFFWTETAHDFIVEELKASPRKRPAEATVGRGFGR
ncbi:unnamed protein product [Symbiodinium natans]|uniref:Uncharacterized protein n=1 Tax=Symbiodinium natans TaxID=878477 RepID=A0A812K0H0_9DINO|nr:unnamed protein product [Symbiodinium natans]